ncbi:MAG: LysM peptidoglycan-binding domain-containing protein, partial [Hyphomicrobiaceae bacterium]|nr:LysM peptidoglycan-binding domain-containing protein [Hyphomicrobiaceae bacterium]
MLARPLWAVGGAALVAAAGCSSDVTRFGLVGSDFLGWGSNSPPAASSAGYMPGDRGYGPGARGGDRYGGGGLQEQALPPVASGGRDDYRPPDRDYRPPGRDDASTAPYAAARPDHFARPPDRTPPPWTDRSPPPWTDKDPFPWPDSAAEKQRLAPAAQQSALWQGRHAMQSGESLYTIAQRYKVSVDELKRANGITDSSKVWAGKVLAVPEGGDGVHASAAPAAPAV